MVMVRSPVFTIPRPLAVNKKTWTSQFPSGVFAVKIPTKTHNPVKNYHPLS